MLYASANQLCPSSAQNCGYVTASGRRQMITPTPTRNMAAIAMKLWTAGRPRAVAFREVGKAPASPSGPILDSTGCARVTCSGTLLERDDERGVAGWHHKPRLS